ncbi:hypothetical protein CO046_00535 [Candidatus Peregrinibacteria bacterium CG_4_9_14_0_2_um_filter_53_11]|nr:MAG: hypothetical protein CO046_00535 [Candidatus Peregrinibacteria bacterium CG_4_9_14_0_2_um_filter_53_11]
MHEPAGKTEKNGKLDERARRILEKLSRTELEQFVHYLSNPWRIIWANFLAGTSRGLGFLLGAAIVITILGFITTQILSQIPLVGDFFTAFNVWIQETIHQSQL